MAARLQPPSAAHWFGTDELGRDIFSRIVYGARTTLYIVVLVAVIVAPDRPADRHGRRLSRRLDRRRADARHRHLPVVPGARAGARLRGGARAGHHNAIIAISLTAWPPIARLARAETLTLAQADFIAAVRLQGAPRRRASSSRHILPMCLPSVIVRVTLDMAGIILTAAGLGFLGLGAQPPSPEWGAMVSSGRQFMLDSLVGGRRARPRHRWSVSLAFNLLGDGLRDVLDPRQELSMTR